MEEKKYIFPQKAILNKIKIDDINISLPELKNIKESKAIAIAKWLIKCIENDKNIKPNYLLPSKPELAYLLGVSIGTIQNSLRYIEDLGYVESKQCIGTFIKDRKETSSIRKLTSKREIAVNKIKQYILDNKFNPGQTLPSSRNLSFAIGCSSNTTRLALEFLGTVDIVEHKFKNSNESGWIVKSIDFTTDKINDDDNITLVKKVENDLKDYISLNLKIGDRIPPHATLSGELSVSIKTIHDALKTLINEGR